MATAQVELEARPGRLVDARAALVLFGIALLSFFVFPGHTFLESDSQIFMPVLLHRADPALFAQEILVERPHTSFTLYDELIHALYRLSGGVRHEWILFAVQVAMRFAGALGVYGLLQALALPPPLALAGAAIFGLGAMVAGPSVLTIEYEPTPRAFALPLVLLALALLARARYSAAGFAGSAAFLLHPPTSGAFWAVYLVWAVAARDPAERRRRLWGLAPLAGAAVLVFFAASLASANGEPQRFFSRIAPAWEKLQRLRARYVFISEWPPILFWVYACEVALLMGAWTRLRRSAPERLRAWLWMLPAVGLVSVPLSWLLLEKLKWSLMPQFQPLRYVLYIVLFGVLLGYAAGVERAWAHRRYVEGLLWFLAAFLLIFQPYHLLWLTPLLLGFRLLSAEGGREWLAAAVGLPLAVAVVALKPFGFAAWKGENPRYLGVSLLLSLLVLLFVEVCRRKSSLTTAASVALVLLLFFAAPLSGRRSSRGVSTPELIQLSDWARAQTPPNAIFLFPDAGRGLEPGVFRYYARRTIYVDWKVGGQVNYFRGFSQIWWQRWQATMEQPFDPAMLEEFRRLGINYLVFRKPPPLPTGPVVFRNRQFTVVCLNMPSAR